MVRAWLMDEDLELDQRLPHRLAGPEAEVSLDELAKLGVCHWFFEPASYARDSSFEELKRSRGYSYQDVVELSPATMANYESKLRSFYEEHIHRDEEIRYVLAGSGYFDVRDSRDRWLRVQVGAGDLIVLPAGIYHRFTLDTSNHIKVLRLFVGEPVWTAHPRAQLGPHDPSVTAYRLQQQQQQQQQQLQQSQLDKTL